MASLVSDTDPFFDIWRRVPPEEKLELMARAHSHGVQAGLVAVTICATIAVGLKLPWVFWTAFLGIPFIFQFASSKAWRDMKPRTMLEYLAARSACRRYAFGVHCEDLTVRLLFKARLSIQFEPGDTQEQLEAELEDAVHKSVWIALFTDTVVAISERPGGAHLEMAYPIDERLAAQSVGFEESYANDRAVLLDHNGRDGFKRRYRITSKYPAALLAFERQLQSYYQEKLAQIERDKAAYREMFSNYAGEFRS